MIERARAALAAARRTDEWPDLAYVLAKDSDGYDCDGNAGRRALVLERLAPEGEPVVTDDDVTRYFVRKARWFPASPDEGHPDTWAHRAEDLEYWGV